MLRELETRILARLTGADRVPPLPIRIPGEVIKSTSTPTSTIDTDVPVTMMLPEEWEAKKIYPSVNVWRIDYLHDPSRQSVGKHNTALATDLNTRQVKNLMLPYRAVYEISILTRFAEQQSRIIEELHKRLPPMGFGSVMVVSLPDGTIRVPMRQIAYVDLTDREQATERNFQMRLNYEFLVWSDYDTWKTERTIRTVQGKVEAIQPVGPNALIDTLNIP